MLCLVLMTTSLLLMKCFISPRVDFASLMHILISVSSLSSVVMVEPRYLKLWVNFTNWLFGRAMVDGSEFSVMSFFASFRELGKKMASVLDLVLLWPTCICIPSLWK